MSEVRFFIWQLTELLRLAYLLLDDYILMQLEYLNRLSTPVQQFILEVEKASGIDIEVTPKQKLNNSGPNGKGGLEILIGSQRVELGVPMNGYFPDGAVRHEVLHMRRFHIEGVPKIVLSENEDDWDRTFADKLHNLDNAIEHILIVPEELKFHPERHQHWESVMQNACCKLNNLPELDRSFVVCLHLTFLRHVMPDSPQLYRIKAFAQHHGFLKVANEFAEQLISIINYRKEEIVQLIFNKFTEIPKNRAALEYISKIRGTYQNPIS